MATRKNHERALESMQVTLDAEIHGRNESNRQRKKLELDINELEIALDHANRQVTEFQSKISILNVTIIEMEVNITDERRKYIELSEKVNSNEHRYSSLIGDLEESRLNCDQLERTRRDLEAQLHDALERIADLQTQNSSMNSYKYQYTIELESVREDYELSLRELRETKDRYNKCLLDLQKVTEELKQEQEHSLSFVTVRKNYESQIKDITFRLEQAEVNGKLTNKQKKKRQYSRGRLKYFKYFGNLKILK